MVIAVHGMWNERLGRSSITHQSRITVVVVSSRPQYGRFARSFFHKLSPQVVVKLTNTLKLLGPVLPLGLSLKKRCML